VQILVVFNVAEDNHILVVNRLALITILVTRFHYENHQLAALCVLANHVAGLVEISAVLTTFEEGLTVIVIQLNFVAVLNKLALASILDFLVHGDFLGELLV
jgi:hypothetical protein